MEEPDRRLLINKDPDNSYPVTVNYSGYTPAAGAPTVHSYTNGATSIAVSQTGTATSQTLPPYSLTTLVLHPAGSPADAPAAPGQPVAGPVTDRTATISWPAATAGGHPIAKYEVWWQNGATGDQFGETPGTSFTVHNLIPGRRYTVNVLTRDNAGGVSWASPPLTFTTGAPATSSCTVRFTTASDWGSGYIGSVDVTNNGSGVIDGWSLTFSWPTGWQRTNGNWNSNLEQTGRDVRVTNVDFNRQLAAGGGTANMGFVGEYSGPNVLPSVFRLNGTICTTTG